MQTRKTTLLLLLLLTSLLSAAQPFQWVKPFISYSSSSGTKTTVDPAGNVYVTGWFQDSMDIAPTRVYSRGQKDIFLTKYNAAGTMLWTKTIGGTGIDIPGDVITDNNGNVFLTGSFSDSVDFDPSPSGISMLYGKDSTIAPGFVLKLSASGNFLWVKQARPLVEGSACGTAIRIAPSGNIYLSGSFRGQIDFDPGPDSTVTGLAGKGESGFIWALRPDGSYRWVTIYQGQTAHGGMYEKGLVIDDHENVTAAGYFAAMIDFDPSPAGVRLVGNDTTYLSFIKRVDSAGNSLFAKIFLQHIRVYGLAADARHRLYLTGESYGSVSFNPDTVLIVTRPSLGFYGFILQMDTDAHLQWWKVFTTKGRSPAHSIAIDGSGSLYISGSMADTVDFDPGPGVHTLYSFSYESPYIVKLDSVGGYVWAAGTTGISPRSYMNGRGVSIAVDPAGTGVYTTGRFRDTVDFDPGMGSSVLYGAPSPGYSGFLLRLGAAPSSVRHMVLGGQVKVFPNPTTGYLRLEAADAWKDASITIVSIAGQVIVHQDHVSGLEFTADISDHPAGVYIISVQEDGQQLSGKIIKR